MVKLIGGQVAYKSPFGLPPIFGLGVGGVSTGLTTGGSQILKYAGIAGVSAIAGATLLGRTQQQQQQAKMSGQSLAKPVYHINVEKGGTANLTDTGGKAGLEQTQQQEQAQTSLDMTSLLIVGIIAIGGLMLFKKK